VYEVVKKKDRGETLTPGDEALVDSFSRQHSALADYDLMKGKGWYKAGNGTAHSLVFMANLVATRGLGTAVEKGVESAVKKEFSSALFEATRKAITKEGKLLAKTSLRRKLGLAIVGAPINVLSSTAGLATSAIMSPITYKTAVDEMIQGVRVDTDSKGKTTVYTPKALYKQLESDYKYKKSVLEDLREKIRSDKSISEEERVAQLQRVMGNIEGLDKEFEQMEYDVHYFTPGEALWKGFTETMKENWSELYAGKLLPKVKIPTMPKRYLKNKFLNKASSAAEKVTSVYREGAAVLNNRLGMGTLSKKLSAVTGENKIWHGLGNEVWEEIVVQAVPTYREDYVNQLKSLKDPEFYQDVIAQTLLLGGGMSATLGVPSRLMNWKKQANFDKLKEGWNWIKDKVGLGDDKNTTTTKTTTTKPVGSHRTGESFVKNDGMYKLHYGERVLTKAENSQYSQGGVSSSPSINISINAVQELGNEIKRAIQPIVETTIKNYQTKQLMKMGIAGGQ